MWVYLYWKSNLYSKLSSPDYTFVCIWKYKMLTYDVYDAALVWKCPNTIPTHNYSTIEVCSCIDCRSWCNGSCHHLCDIKLKWGVVSDHPTLVMTKKRSRDAEGLNVPLMSKRRNCTCKGHCLPRTWSLHTGLQLSTWNWNLSKAVTCGISYTLLICKPVSWKKYKKPKDLHTVIDRTHENDSILLHRNSFEHNHCGLVKI